MLSLFLALALSSFSHAGGVVVISGERASLDSIPKGFVSALNKAGVVAAPNDGMLKVEAEALTCTKNAKGVVQCTFALPNSEERKALSNDVFALLETLDKDEEGMSVGGCQQDGACEYELHSVSCMINERLDENAEGKFGCSLIST